ncbi:MAG: hypothetical protein Q7T95_14375 [Hydrogenophaga sp.]|nr:hypothetical protein [Hydrogenophaga sp.]
MLTVFSGLTYSQSMQISLLPATALTADTDVEVLKVPRPGEVVGKLNFSKIIVSAPHWQKQDKLLLEDINALRSLLPNGVKPFSPMRWDEGYGPALYEYGVVAKHLRESPFQIRELTRPLTEGELSNAVDDLLKLHPLLQAFGRAHIERVFLEIQTELSLRNSIDGADQVTRELLGNLPELPLKISMKRDYHKPQNAGAQCTKAAELLSELISTHSHSVTINALIEGYGKRTGSVVSRKQFSDVLLNECRLMASELNDHINAIDQMHYVASQASEFDIPLSPLKMDADYQKNFRQGTHRKSKQPHIDAIQKKYKDAGVSQKQTQLYLDMFDDLTGSDARPSDYQIAAEYLRPRFRFTGTVVEAAEEAVSELKSANEQISKFQSRHRIDYILESEDRMLSRVFRQRMQSIEFDYWLEIRDSINGLSRVDAHVAASRAEDSARVRRQLRSIEVVRDLKNQLRDRRLLREYSVMPLADKDWSPEVGSIVVSVNADASDVVRKGAILLTATPAHARSAKWMLPISSNVTLGQMIKASIADDVAIFMPNMVGVNEAEGRKIRNLLKQVAKMHLHDVQFSITVLHADIQKSGLAIEGVVEHEKHLVFDITDLLNTAEHLDAFRVLARGKSAFAADGRSYFVPIGGLLPNVGRVAFKSIEVQK